MLYASPSEFREELAAIIPRPRDSFIRRSLGVGGQTKIGVLGPNAAWRKGFSTTYTIARSLSLGMNLTFAKGGYSFAGTLVNNTQISGQIESMNVWYKHLLDSSDSARAVS